MSDGFFECVCQFFRAQSENLQGIMQSLGNQSTITDLGPTEQLAVPQSPGIFTAATPMHFFMAMLTVIWAYMYMFSRQQKAVSFLGLRTNSCVF